MRVGVYACRCVSVYVPMHVAGGLEWEDVVFAKREGVGGTFATKAGVSLLQRTAFFVDV